MMVQNARPGEAHFVCTMREHNDLCGQFARAFGNDQFERLDPFEEMVYVVSHHDYGWDEFDTNPTVDPKTRMPAGIGAAPADMTIEANRRSPQYNEARHLYCGLLASMHSWGLFNERYGYSDFRVRKGGSLSVPIPSGNRDAGLAMLDGERARQERLRAALAADPRTRPWVEEKHLFQNYKQLQFFDTLALYFNLRHESEREVEVYTHVPMTAEKDANVTVTPQGGLTYALAPFPFAGQRLEVVCQGRYVTPLPDGETAPARAGAMLAALPKASQTYTFVAG